MWVPDGYTYDEFNIVGLKASLNLQDDLRMSNPELELDGALYAALCILDSGLKALPADALPLDEAGRTAFTNCIVECFGTEKVFGFVRAGRTIVLVIRSKEPAEPEQEAAFFQDVETSAMTLHYSIEDNIGYPVSVSLSSVFNIFEYCGQVVCETLTAADFVRVMEMPAVVVSPQYCDSVREIVKTQNPGYRISNYERPIISAMLNGNLAHAERLVNDLLTAHIMDPLYVFPTIRSSMLNTMRLCQSMCCLEPRAFADETPRLPQLQKEIGECPTAAMMRALIHEYFSLLDSYAQRHREAETRTERMNKIIEYISEHISDPLLGAPMVCDAFNMSTTHFSRIFKEDLGVNFSVYLQTLRITKAKKLLAESDLSINAVAQEICYINSQNLLRLFKRYEGISPSAYRQMAGGSNAPDEIEE